MGVVSQDVAKEEIDKWLDYKKVSEKKREDFADQIEALTTAIEDGTLMLRQDCTLVQTLKFPIGQEKPITELEYKPRLQLKQVHMHMQGVKNTDADGRVLAHVAALTSTAKGILQALDTEDYVIGPSIAVFFM